MAAGGRGGEDRARGAFLRRAAALAAIVALAVLGAPLAYGYWSGFEQPQAVAGAAVAASLDAGLAPTVAETGNGEVVLSWEQGSLSNDVAASGYAIARYDAASGEPATIAAGCAGVVAAATCTEPAVPAGEWRYTVTPLFGANWRGAESPESAAVSTEPGTLTLDTVLFGGTLAPLPADVTGTLAGFAPDEPVAYSLDAGTPLSGSPSQVGAGGSATITSLEIPAGIGDGPHTITAAGSQTEASLGIVVDTTPPSAAGSVDAGDLGGSSGRYSTSVDLEISFAPGSDETSGLAASGAELMRASASLSSDGTGDGACGPYGTYVQVGADDPASPQADTVPAAGSCYRYRYVVADNVGNQATYESPDVKVDTTAPSAPTLSFSALSNSYWAGTGTVVFYNPAAGSGGFEVTASATDAESGIAAYDFPVPASGWSRETSPDAAAYAWASPEPAAPGPEDVAAANNAGAVAATAFTPTPDAVAPADGAIAYPQGLITTASVPVDGSVGTDAGSGIDLASLTYERSEATFDGSCQAFGPFTTVFLEIGNDESVVTNHCYQYRLLVSDNVGNLQTYVSPATVWVATE